MTKITFEITGPQQARLAAEFMAKLVALDYPEDVFHYNLANDVRADLGAEQAIAKAAKESKPSPAPVAPAAETPALPTVSIADCQAVASAKGKTAGVKAVKAIIASFGAPSIRDLAPETLPNLKAALEALV